MEQISQALVRNGLSEEDSKIADICFAFNNREMLLLLQERNEALCKTDFVKANEIEDKLTVMKDEHYDQMIVPNQFYCTFMYGEAQQKILEMKRIRILDQNIKLRDTKSPDDIIWYNRGVARSF